MKSGDDDQGDDWEQASRPSEIPIPLVRPDAGAEGAPPAPPESAHPAQPEGALPAQPEGALPAPLDSVRPAQPEGALPAQPEGALPASLDSVRPAAPPEEDDAAPLLRVRDLSVSFITDGGVVRALDRVSFDVPRGRTVALVGESGCGKTVTSLSILRLLPAPYASIDGGAIEHDGRDLLALSEREMRAVRGGKIAMIFQEPMTSLNPVYTVGAQIAEAVRLHLPMSRSSARVFAVSLLRKVGFPEPEAHVDSYPHELSGGMRQRVMIAMALAPGPELLIADEPTTALDMTTQAQILELLERIKAETSMSLLLIAHDLALVGELADEIVVLYAGVVVERGPARRVLSAPAHPYTRALLRSVPSPGFRPPRVRGEKARRLPTIRGGLPDLRSPPPGCRFHDRCDEVFERCLVEAPDPYAVPPGTGHHAARCFLVGRGRAAKEGAA